MATGGGRIVPTLDELTAQVGSRLDAAIERARYFEGIYPPAIDKGPPVEGMATLEFGKGVGDDLLDHAPGVRVLFLKSKISPRQPPFDLRRPHENIEGLIAHGEVTAAALSMLPRLRFVQLTWPATPDLLAALPTSLEELWGMDDVALDALTRLPRLRYLAARVRTGRAAQCRTLAGMTELRVLHIEALEALRGTSALGRLENLEDLSVDSVSSFDFKGLSGCRRLKTLTLGGLGSTKTLDGIERLEALESLSLGGRLCPPIHPIARVPRLENLSISSLRAPPDLDAVGEMTRLRSLFLYIGSASSVYRLKDAGLFAELRSLESLECLALLQNQNLTPLGNLKSLKFLSFYGTFPEEAVRWLQEQLPACKIDLTVGTPLAAPPEIEIGLLKASKLDDGRWSVWQDLRLVLDFDSNHDAEDAVKAEMTRTNPEALERIEFDAENDGFAAYLKSREDLEALAAVVGALASKQAASS